MTKEKFLTLHEAADQLGVHYMTVYRYVRTGRLAAQQQGSRWVVPAGELSLLRPARDTPGRRAPGDNAVSEAAVERLVARLVIGDESGAWDIVQELLAHGATPSAVYLGAFCPALAAIGAAWADEKITVADEHQASVVVQRLIGRLGPLFRTRGPRIGTVVIGAPAGEMHALPTALVADILRARRFRVLDLGANVPADAFTRCAAEVDALTAVVVSVTTRRYKRSARVLIAALRAGGIAAPIIIGGAGVRQADASSLGADQVAATTDDLVAALGAHLGRLPLL